MSDWAHIFIRSIIFIVVLIVMTRIIRKKADFGNFFF